MSSYQKKMAHIIKNNDDDANCFMITLSLVAHMRVSSTMNI